MGERFPAPGLRPLAGEAEPVHGAKQTAVLSLVALVLGCATPQPSAGSLPGQVAEPARIKRVTAAVMSDPITLNTTVSQGVANLPGIDALEQLVNAGMVVEDDQGTVHAQLAQAVPTLENGLWKLSPDGRMETTWRVRDGSQWHDGAPFSSSDLVFTVRVGQEREVPAFGNPVYAWVERVSAPDPATITIAWKQPYIEADRMFMRTLAYPMPKHLLEASYEEDRSSFAQLPYWGRDYVGAGPFKVREWIPGSHLLLGRHDQYPLGRPHIAEIEVRFVPDPNTLMANVIAGAAEVTIGRGLSIEQALQVRDQWRDGTIAITVNGWQVIFPQMLSPNPAVVAETPFRRALLHSVDRQAMVDSLMAGLTGVAHHLVLPREPEYQPISGRVARYDYDPRKATQLIEGLGYAKAADGSFRDAAGQRLAVELRTVSTDIAQKSTFATADAWQRVGVGVETVVIPAARQGDLHYRALYPGFQLFNQPNDLSAIPNFHSSKVPVQENGYVGPNYARYGHPSLDALVDRYHVTIPRQERAEVVGQLLTEMADQLHVLMPLFYNGQPTVVGNRLVGVTAGGRRSTQTWNAHLWDVR